MVGLINKVFPHGSWRWCAVKLFDQYMHALGYISFAVAIYKTVCS